MIKKSILYFLLICFPKILSAQTDTIPPIRESKSKIKSDKIPFKDRIYFGGNLGLQFGTQTYIDISPLAGYKFTETVSAGAGITYIYYKYKDSYYTYSTSIYGGRIFGRYLFTNNLFAHAEVELLNMELYDLNINDYYRKNIISPFVGGGYIQRFSNNAGLYLLLLFNLNDSAESPYTNPIIRIGFNLGI